MQPNQVQMTDTKPTDAMPPATPERSGLVVYIVELAQKLPPQALVVLVVIGLFWLNRSDMKERENKMVDAVTLLNQTLKDQGERREMMMREAHASFQSKQERQWEEIRKGTDIQTKTLAAIERLTEEVKRKPGGM